MSRCSLFVRVTLFFPSSNFFSIHLWRLIPILFGFILKWRNYMLLWFVLLFSHLNCRMTFCLKYSCNCWAYLSLTRKCKQSISLIILLSLSRFGRNLGYVLVETLQGVQWKRQDLAGRGGYPLSSFKHIKPYTTFPSISCRGESITSTDVMISYSS